MLHAQEKNTVSTSTTREVTVKVKVVFIGFDRNQILTDYLTWNNPQRRYQKIALPGIDTGTVYTPEYEYAFATTDFTSEFSSYLKSVGKTETRINVLWNETYFKIDSGSFLNYTHFRVDAVNTYYPADDVESWLISKSSGFGGVLSDGYTLVVADLSKYVPSVTGQQFFSLNHKEPVVLTPHFYNKTFIDYDLRVQLNRRYMTAWGGHERLFFIDTSAGPGPAAEQWPVQWADAANRIASKRNYSAVWLTQFLSDYIGGAVYNVFLPDLLYPITYSNIYRVKIFVIDNRTKSTPPIESTLNTEEIRRRLQALVSFANVDVTAEFMQLKDDADLNLEVKAATSPSTIGTNPIVDARPVYDWLSLSGKGQMARFLKVTRNQDIYDIPVFVFAFDGEYNFGFTYKEYVLKGIDFDRTIWGVSLYDLVLISHSEDDLVRGDLVEPKQPGRGFGFTNTIIHEVGHMFGLMHPFSTSYDPTENFVSSVMAYYPYEDGFSQFDKDALLRGYADEYIRTALQILESTPNFIINWADINSAKSRIGNAEESYRAFNYTQAAQDAFQAYLDAARANVLAGGRAPGQAYSVMGMGIAFVLGAAVMYTYLTRRRRTGLRTTGAAAPLCSQCQRKLTWVAQYERWYCHNCKKYE